MKFGERLLKATIPEWSSKYIQYKLLQKQIERIQYKILARAAHNQVYIEAYQNVQSDNKEIKQYSKIDVSELEEDKIFWELFEANIKMVEQFYKDRINLLTEQFNSFVLEFVRNDLLPKYVPLEKNKIEMHSPTIKELAQRKLTARVQSIEKQPPQSAKNLFSNKQFPLRAMTKRKDSKIETEAVSPVKILNLSEYPNFDPITNSRRALEKAFIEYYLGLHLLKKYAKTNAKGFKKTIKRYDKRLGVRIARYRTKDLMNNCEFKEITQLKLLIKESETTFADAFTDGEYDRAMLKLRVPERRKAIKSANFKLGFNLGFGVPWLIIMIYWVASDVSSNLPRFTSVIRAYRFVGVIILMAWCWGLDMLIWSYYKINYVFILDLNRRSHYRYQHMFALSSLYTIVWSISLWLFYMSGLEVDGFQWLGDIYWQIYPLSLLLISLCVLIWFSIKTDGWLLRTLENVVLTWKSKYFKDYFLTDQIVSIVITLVDLQYTICFFVSDAWTGGDACTSISRIAAPIINSLPFTWRVIQEFLKYKRRKNIYDLINMGKYFVGYFVIIFSTLGRQDIQSPFFYLWIIATIVSTIYSYTWDIFKDWGFPGFFQVPKTRNIFPRWFYFFAMSSNLLLRLMWTLTIAPDSIGIVLNPLIFGTILVAVEILRRGLWNLLRMENEQIKNSAIFKAIHELPLNTKEFTNLDSITIQSLETNEEPKNEPYDQGITYD